MKHFLKKLGINNIPDIDRYKLLPENPEGDDIITWDIKYEDIMDPL